MTEYREQNSKLVVNPRRVGELKFVPNALRGSEFEN